MEKNLRQARNFFQLAVLVSILFYSCKSKTGDTGFGQMPPQELPVITISSVPAKIYQYYTASLQGSRDIEIRPRSMAILIRSMWTKVPR